MGDTIQSNQIPTGILRFVSRLLVVVIGAGFGLLYAPNPSFAGVSATFQVRDDQVNPSQFQQTSAGFTIYGSVEPLVQSQTSPTFGAQTGSPLRINAPAAGPGGGGGQANLPTGACTTPKNLTLTNIECNRFYKGLIKLPGTKDKDTDYVFVNDDLGGVYFSNQTTWEKEVLLQIGVNKLVIYGKNFCDAKTPPLTITITRARMGDTNDDSQTNDYDLSTFTRRWEKPNDCLTDFNRDQITDDYDLSLLASSWTG